MEDSDIFESSFIGNTIKGDNILKNHNMINLGGGSFYNYHLNSESDNKVKQNQNYRIVKIKNNVVYLKEVR